MAIHAAESPDQKAAAGSPSQQPSPGHVGGLRAQRGDPAPEAPASEEIVGDVVGLAVEVEADPHHQGEIDDECDQDADVSCMGRFLLIFVLGCRMGRFCSLPQ